MQLSSPGRIVTLTGAVLACAAAVALVYEGVQDNGLERRRAGPFALPFRAGHEALRLEAETQLLAGQPLAAAASARRSLATSPLDRRALRVLALAEDRANDHAGAVRLMARAAALSWHETSAQLWLLREAVAGEDIGQAAIRADAVLRADPTDDLALAAVTLLLETNEGQDAVARRLALNPPWRGGVLRALDVGSALGAARVASLLDAMRATGAPPTMPEVASLTERMIAAGSGGIAQAYWQGVAPGRQSAGELIDDPDFAASAAALQRGDPGLPFGWASGGAGDVDFVGGRDDAGRGALAIEDGGDGARGFVYRYVVLSPGPYRLSFAATEDGAPGEDLRADLACIGSPGQPKLGERTARRDGRYARIATNLTVPEGCEAVKLSLTLAPGRSSRSRAFAVRDVHLRSAAG